MTNLWPTFDDFWTAYDRKIDRVKCEKKWAKLTQKEKETIMAHVPLYVKSTPDKQFRRHPATYLNNKSWENEIIQRRSNAIPSWNELADAVARSGHYPGTIGGGR